MLVCGAARIMIFDDVYLHMNKDLTRKVLWRAGLKPAAVPMPAPVPLLLCVALRGMPSASHAEHAVLASLFPPAADREGSCRFAHKKAAAGEPGLLGGGPECPVVHCTGSAACSLHASGGSWWPLLPVNHGACAASALCLT